MYYNIFARTHNGSETRKLTYLQKEPHWLAIWDPFGFRTAYLQEDVYPDEHVGLPVALNQGFGEVWRP